MLRACVRRGRGGRDRAGLARSRVVEPRTAALDHASHPAHWGIAWIALLALSWHWLGRYPGAGLAFGFACGGLMYLLADWPNPLGVPWIRARHSLNLWTSGHCDLIVVALAWGAAFLVADDAWFHRAYGHMLLDALRTLHA